MTIPLASVQKLPEYNTVQQGFLNDIDMASRANSTLATSGYLYTSGLDWSIHSTESNVFFRIAKDASLQSAARGHSELYDLIREIVLITFKDHQISNVFGVGDSYKRLRLVHSDQPKVNDDILPATVDLLDKYSSPDWHSVNRFLQRHDELIAFLNDIATSMSNYPDVNSLSLEYYFDATEGWEKLYLNAENSLDDADKICELEDNIFSDLFKPYFSIYKGHIIFSLV